MAKDDSPGSSLSTAIVRLHDVTAVMMITPASWRRGGGTTVALEVLVCSQKAGRTLPRGTIFEREQPTGYSINRLPQRHLELSY